MKILESAENYLESILILRNEKGRVRSIDIVNHLGFSKPSVSIAMKQLEENDQQALSQNTFPLCHGKNGRVPSIIRLTRIQKSDERC